MKQRLRHDIRKGQKADPRPVMLPATVTHTLICREHLMPSSCVCVQCIKRYTVVCIRVQSVPCDPFRHTQRWRAAALNPYDETKWSDILDSFLIANSCGNLKSSPVIFSGAEDRFYNWTARSSDSNAAAARVMWHKQQQEDVHRRSTQITNRTDYDKMTKTGIRRDREQAQPTDLHLQLDSSDIQGIHFVWPCHWSSSSLASSLLQLCRKVQQRLKKDPSQFDDSDYKYVLYLLYFMALDWTRRHRPS